jgi:outer membrane biosynthesis protein TonB
VVAVLAMLAGACTKQPPRVTAEPPPALEVPVIPPRVLAPLPDEPAEQTTPEPAEEEPPAPRRTPRPRRPEARPEQPSVEPAKPEAGPEPAQEAKPAPAEGVVRTPETRNEPEIARKVRELLAGARRDLKQVNVPALGRDARAQYDTAQRFIDQAEGALSVRNYMFANYLADKAEALARGLLGR